MRNLDTSILKEARAAVADVIEELAEVAMHLREAIDEASGGRPVTVVVASVDDAHEAIDRARAELLKIRDKAGRWAVWAEGKEGGS